MLVSTSRGLAAPSGAPLGAFYQFEPRDQLVKIEEKEHTRTLYVRACSQKEERKTRAPGRCSNNSELKLWLNFSGLPACWQRIVIMCVF